MARKRLPSTQRKTLIYRVAELFLNGKKAAEIAKVLSAEFGLSLSRERIYPLLQSAHEEGVLMLVPPVDDVLRNSLCERFGIDRSRVTVVSSSSHAPPVDPEEVQEYRALFPSEPLALSGAEVVLRLILKRGAEAEPPVHLGLGPGRVSYLLAKQLSRLVRARPKCPPLELHAITSGCPSTLAEYAPVAFFNFFDRDLVQKTHGFFTDSVVQCSRYENVKNRPGFDEAMQCRHKIDIVCTSLGDRDDKHDLFRGLLEQTKDRRVIKALEAKGWVGNVQYRPYSELGPIEEPEDAMRIPTLFELEDLHRLASTSGKHVVLLVKPCDFCGNPRTHALKPLLESEALKVWSEIVVDARTVRALLQPERPTGTEGREDD